MNIYQKIIKVRKPLEYLKKDGQGYGYQYVKESTLLAMIKDAMDEQGLILIQELTSIQDCPFQLVAKDKSVKEVVGIRGNLRYTWINADNPEERFSCEQVLQYSSGDIQGCGGLLSYGMRYFLLKFFNIPTDDLDPDKFTKKIDDLLDEEDSSVEQENNSIYSLKELTSFVLSQGLKSCNLESFVEDLAKKRSKTINDIIQAAMSPALQEKFLKSYREYLIHQEVA